MKKSVVLYLIGTLLKVEAGFLILPIIVGLIYQESLSQIAIYAGVALFVFVIGFLISRKKPLHFKIQAREGLITVALGWILLSFFGALPLFFSKEIPNLIDAFFEITSGFTTTGSSILSDLSILHKSSLFWRSFTHLIGGMGVLVFALAILPTEKDAVQLMRAEVPGPQFGKIVSKLKHTARILYAIYLSMTCILMIILVLVKVPFFDAMLLAFGTAGTGGFSVHNEGFLIYENYKLVETIIGFGMLAFGVNFNLYYFVLIGALKDVINDEEFHYYLLIVIVAIIVIFFNILNNGNALLDNLRHVFFTVSSIITTTGFTTTDFDKWPLFSQLILLLLMFIGGCAGSTAGGIKVSRIVMYLKLAACELKRMAHPKRVVVAFMSNKKIDKTIEAQILHYLLVYIVIFMFFLICISLEAKDFTTAFSSVAATFNNIGPGLSHVGPTKNFSHFSDVNTFLLSFAMIAGRLEIFPVIILFSPTTMKKMFSTQKNNS